MHHPPPAEEGQMEKDTTSDKLKPNTKMQQSRRTKSNLLQSWQGRVPEKLLGWQALLSRHIHDDERDASGGVHRGRRGLQGLCRRALVSGLCAGLRRRSLQTAT